MCNDVCSDESNTSRGNLEQDEAITDNFTNAQRQLLHWYRRLAHVDVEKIKDFTRQGLLPKEIETSPTPLCPFCTQAKQCHTSMSKKDAGNSIKSVNL